MTSAMLIDLGPKIRANTINQGWVEVERTREELSDGRIEEADTIHPVGRIGTPEDVDEVATFFTSDDAAFVTGANLLVDSGRTASMQDDTLPDYW